MWPHDYFSKPSPDWKYDLLSNDEILIEGTEVHGNHPELEERSSIWHRIILSGTEEKIIYIHTDSMDGQSEWSMYPCVQCGTHNLYIGRKTCIKCENILLEKDLGRIIDYFCRIWPKNCNISRPNWRTVNEYVNFGKYWGLFLHNRIKYEIHFEKMKINRIIFHSENGLEIKWPATLKKITRKIVYDN